jgi:hypothetical protein
MEYLSDLGRLELLVIACRLWLTHRRTPPTPQPKEPVKPYRLPRFWILIEPDLFDRRQRHYLGESQLRRFTDQRNWCYSY